MPNGVTWIRDAAVGVDAAARTVTAESGRTLHDGYLALAPGNQLAFGRLPGLTETLGQHGVSSNYRSDLAPLTWEFIRDLRTGTAVFTMPPGPRSLPASRRATASKSAPSPRSPRSTGTAGESSSPTTKRH